MWNIYNIIWDDYKLENLYLMMQLKMKKKKKKGKEEIKCVVYEWYILKLSIITEDTFMC